MCEELYQDGYLEASKGSDREVFKSRNGRDTYILER